MCFISDGSHPPKSPLNLVPGFLRRNFRLHTPPYTHTHTHTHARFIPTHKHAHIRRAPPPPPAPPPFHPLKLFAIKERGWISQRAIITSGDVRARRCVGPVVLDEIRRDYTATEQIITHTHTHTHTHTATITTTTTIPSFLCGA